MKNIKWNKVRVLMSDNVTTDKEWTVYELRFKGNDIPRVDQQTAIRDGTYGHDFIGMSIVDLHKWQMFDPTGTHPEVYHEVYDWRQSRYRDFMSAIDIRQIVCGECKDYNTESTDQGAQSVKEQ